MATDTIHPSDLDSNAGFSDIASPRSKKLNEKKFGIDMDMDNNTPMPASAFSKQNQLKLNQNSNFKPKNAWLLHPVMIAVYAGIFVFILLCAAKPGFVTSKVPLSEKENEIATETQKHMRKQMRKLSLVKVTIWSVSVTALVISLPYLVQLISKHTKKK